MAAFILSKLDNYRLMRECADGGFGVSEIEHLRVSVICRIHLLQGRVSVQHGPPCFHPVILDQFSCNANPFAVFEGADKNKPANKKSIEN